MKQVKVVLCVAVALLGMGTAAWAQGDVSYEVTGDLFSKYVWRGHNYSDDWVLQPGFSATSQGLTGGIWGNMDLTNENGEDWEFTEYDLYVDYSGQVTDMVGYSVGGIYYYFPGRDATTEVYAGVNVDTIARPSLTVYWDVDEVGGFYANLAVEHSLEYWPDLPFGIDLGASLGWGDSGYNEDYWGVDDNELNDLVLSAAFPFEVGPVKVTPSIHYVTLLDSDIRDAVRNDDTDMIYAGVSCAYGF
ncbi:MAG: hypothetical protein JSW27_25050 [Phycisphaerales bacterium]|nr:MAG: hypothetical protein JSW27_25050 [Phycisphaerales bacterium]